MQNWVLAAVSFCCAFGQPPKEIPADLLDEFTLGGKVPRARFFVDDTNDGKGTHYKYPRSDIDYMVSQAEAQLERVGAIEDESRLHKSFWLLRAFAKNPIRDMDVVVFGSMEPWFESVCVAAGAKSVTTIEYNKLTYDHPKIKTLTVAEADAAMESGGMQFDAALSISSFDHDGLGRYGDPVDPNGDLKAMQKAMSMLKPGGLMFLTIPVGPDILVWNLHRRYGEHRLPMMLRGWEEVGRVAWNGAKLTAEANYRQSYEPVFILRRPPGVSADGSEPTPAASDEMSKEEL
jgi:hypothetical protein